VEGEEMKQIAFSIGVALVFLAFGAFVNWDLNPGNWSMGARYFTASSTVIFIFLSVAIVRAGK
jgi:uncharacterized membrane protein